MSEKNLPPSEQRTKQARERGQIGISNDVIAVAKLALLGELAFATLPVWSRQIGEVFAACISLAPHARQLRLSAIWSVCREAVLAGLFVSAVGAVIALVATLVQTRGNVAHKAFENGPQKLDPAANLKQLFSLQKLVMLPVNLAKVLMILAICATFIHHRLHEILQMFRLSPDQGWAVAAEILHGCLRSVTMALIAIATCDFALQRFLTMRQLRMDMTDMKREHKENEGDPHAKGHRKQIARELGNGKPPSPEARRPSVVVVNPEHIAIGLVLDMAQGLPRVVSKSTGEAAQHMRNQAVRDGIPVVRFVSLARMLYATGREGAFIPSQSIQAVAQVFRFIGKLDGQPLAPDTLLEINEQGEHSIVPIDVLSIGASRLKGPGRD